MSTKTINLNPYSESSSTPTYFNKWASWINYCLASFGWSQTTDTGSQLAQWFSGTITSATNISGNTWRYACSGGITGTTSNSAPQVGNALIISGFTSSSAGNNGTFVVTSVAGGSGTFDVTNPTGTTNVSDGTGVITQNTNYTTGSTNTYPPANAANTALWEVWKPTDSLASTYTFYFKIWYGNNSTSGTIPGVWIQLGNSTDGSGNLTGSTTIAYSSQTASSSNSNTYPCYAAGSTNWFAFALWDNNSNGMVLFSVERSKNTAGADTSTYAHIVQISYNNHVRQQALFSSISYGLAGQAETGALLLALPTSATTFSYGSNVGISPVWPEIGGLGNPLLGVVGVLYSDFTDQLSFSTIREDGNSHTYLPILVTSGTDEFGPNQNSNARLAIRYE